jgi:hypothetical protein
MHIYQGVLPPNEKRRAVCTENVEVFDDLWRCLATPGGLWGSLGSCVALKAIKVIFPHVLI